MDKKKQGLRERVVESYFSYLQRIQAGESEAVEGMLDLWDDEGRLSFVGSPPLTGEFRGHLALAALYKNLTGARGLQVSDPDADLAKSVLGRAKSRPTRARARGDKLVSEWSSDVETEDGKRLEISGSNAFEFKGDKISGLDIVVSPRPGAADGFAIDDLRQLDIGRLALAAWAVV